MGLEDQVRQMQANHRQLERALDRAGLADRLAFLRNRTLMRFMGTDPRPLTVDVPSQHRHLNVPAELEFDLVAWQLLGNEFVSAHSATAFGQAMWELACATEATAPSNLGRPEAA